MASSKRSLSPTDHPGPSPKRVCGESDPDPSSLSLLPNEMLENILCQLPAATLLLTANRVCKRWNNIIAREAFAFWKKLYHRYKLTGEVSTDMSEAFEEMFKPKENFPSIWTELTDKSVMQTPPVEEGGLTLETFYPTLLLYLKTVFAKSIGCGVESHSKHDAVKRMLAERLPEVADSPVAAVGAICVLADDAWEIRRLITCLVATATIQDVSELLYCVATALLWAKRKLDLPLRVHFNLFQALYWHENEWTATPTVAPTKPATAPPKNGQRGLLAFAGFTRKVQNKVVPTAERQQIIGHKIDPEVKSVTKIVAFAGTGKTTTLIRLCESNPNLTFLAMMYNRAAKDEAKRRFPAANVLCYTAHGMAMNKAGFLYSKKLTPNLKAKALLDLKDDTDIITELSEGVKERHRLSPADINMQRHCSQIVKTVEAFMNSADTEVTAEHVPSLWVDAGGEGLIDRRLPVPMPVQEWVLRDAKIVWEVMSDPEDARIRIPHDGYLKVWQLRSPSLRYVKPHPRAEPRKVDVLLIDEGQDMNPAMLDVFIKQEMPVIIVGDPNQQIYMFRGAVNALNSFPCTQTFYLTQSFRFGPEIAEIANCCLDTQKGDDRRTLVGGNKRNVINRRVGQKPLTGKKTVAFIARSNARLLDKAIEVICRVPSSSITPRGVFAGGIQSYNLEDYLDILRLKEGRNQEMKKWKNFKSFSDFETFAKNTSDPELLSKLRVVGRFQPVTLRSHIDKLTKACRDPPVGKTTIEPDYVFTTGHKAKGLEWDTVEILDDFLPSVEFKDGPMVVHNPAEDEKNLLYVAVTRAKRELFLSDTVRLLLVASQNMFHRFGAPTPATASCADCGQTPEGGWESLRLVTIRDEVPTSTGDGKPLASLFCPGCCVLVNTFFDVPSEIRDLIGESAMTSLNHSIALRHCVGPRIEKEFTRARRRATCRIFDEDVEVF